MIRKFFYIDVGGYGRIQKQYNRVETRLNSIRKRKYARESCRTEISLRCIHGCVDHCELRRQWHSRWIYGEFPTIPLKPSMSPPVSVHRRNLDGALAHRGPAISDQLNIDPLEDADPSPTESAPMDGFGFFYLISPHFDT